MSLQKSYRPHSPVPWFRRLKHSPSTSVVSGQVLYFSSIATLWGCRVRMSTYPRRGKHAARYSSRVSYLCSCSSHASANWKSRSEWKTGRFALSDVIIFGMSGDSFNLVLPRLNRPDPTLTCYSLLRRAILVPDCGNDLDEGITRYPHRRGEGPRQVPSAAHRPHCQPDQHAGEGHVAPWMSTRRTSRPPRSSDSATGSRSFRPPAPPAPQELPKESDDARGSCVRRRGLRRPECRRKPRIKGRAELFRRP